MTVMVIVAKYENILGVMFWNSETLDQTLNFGKSGTVGTIDADCNRNRMTLSID